MDLFGRSINCTEDIMQPTGAMEASEAQQQQKQGPEGVCKEIDPNIFGMPSRPACESTSEWQRYGQQVEAYVIHREITHGMEIGRVVVERDQLVAERHRFVVEQDMALAWYELLSRSPESPEVSSTFSRWHNAKPLANQKDLKFMRRLDKIASHLPNDIKPGELVRMYRLSLSLTTELSRALASADPYPTTYPDMKKLVSKLEAWEFKEKPRLKLEAVEIRDRLYDTKNPMLKLEDSAQS
ncbi:hypothetical protein MMC22_008200 [Lobaria immixta]|nr:hypothetical protein [Lobaria immixta]